MIFIFRLPICRPPSASLALILLLVLLLGPRMAVAAGLAAVAAPDRHGTETAEAVLSAGGNAVDAAVATAFVLAVTYPEAGNLGGGGFVTLSHRGANYFLDFREVAPASASRDMYLDADGRPIVGASTIGHRAAGVPGTVAGLWALHARFGTLPWRRLLEPAIALARDGFVPERQLLERIAAARDDYAGKTNFDDYFGALSPDKPFRQRELAATLTRIAREGPRGFYEGRTARLIESEMRRGRGLISRQDLLSYRALWREPLIVRWRGFELVTAPPPSSGGIALAQLLGIKDLMAADFAGAEHNSSRYVHLVAEIQKRVFADRAEYLGDPDFTTVPVTRLIAPEYLRQRAAEIQRDRPSAPERIRAGLRESLETTHFSILDPDGNALSLTYTLNGSFGNGVVVRGAGFLLNNEMDDFSVKPGQPNLYGVIGGKANEIVPGKRMLSSMTPTVILEEGRVRMIIGTPGGSTIFTSVFQAIVNRIDFRMSTAQSVAAPRFHHQLIPPNLIVYSRCCTLSSETIDSLRGIGYRVEKSPWEFGDLQLIDIDSAGEVTAASDPRGRGVSRVFSVPTNRAVRAE
ncbi:MAG: gamma-glutamyltransferase [Steroidobacteraceae bacterium]